MNNSDNNSTNSNDDNFNSDEETYININDLIENKLKKIYQIQVNNDNFIIKHIGMGTDVPDIIIKESFGKKNNLSIYNCVYTDTEINFLKLETNKDKLLPIIKMVEKIDGTEKIYSISIKINEEININKILMDFNILLTYSSTTGYIHQLELEKNINSGNIIEKMLESIIELGFVIL